MKEQDLMCIKLHGVNRIGLKKIIDFIYTAKLSLNMENLQDTLEAASFLQILPVLDFCKVFLISGVRRKLSRALSNSSFVNKKRKRGFSSAKKKKVRKSKRFDVFVK